MERTLSLLEEASNTLFSGTGSFSAVVANDALAPTSVWTRAIRAVARLVFGKLLPRLPYPVVRGPLRGCWYILGATAGEAGGVSVYLGLQEVEQTRWLQRLLRPGQVFFDVGANVGFYSLLGARLVQAHGRVVALEPLPRNLAFLHRHLQINRLRNVTILPLACADNVTTELFCEGENNALGKLADDHSGTTAMLVSTTTVDTIVDKMRIEPDVLKIDVEGAELRVLRGAEDLLTRKRPTVLLSVHSGALRDLCVAYLEEKHYRIEPLNAGSMDRATEFLARPITS